MIMSDIKEILKDCPTNVSIGPGTAPPPLNLPTNTDPGPSGDPDQVVPPEPKLNDTDTISFLTRGLVKSGG
jgi:hypothetical protein